MRSSDCARVPTAISSLDQFFTRLIDSICMCTDERVQTKENMARTCFPASEYVGVIDFKLEHVDFDFLWRKGYASTVAWLETRAEKNKAAQKRKHVRVIPNPNEMYIQQPTASAT